MSNLLPGDFEGHLIRTVLLMNSIMYHMYIVQVFTTVVLIVHIARLFQFGDRS